MTDLTQREQALITESAKIAASTGRIQVFLDAGNPHDFPKLHRGGEIPERVYTLRLNGKPYSRTGENAGRIRTRAFAATASLSEACSLLQSIVAFTTDALSSHKVYCLINAAEEGDEVWGLELSRAEALEFTASVMPEILSSGTLAQIDAAEWGEHLWISRRD